MKSKGYNALLFLLMLLVMPGCQDKSFSVLKEPILGMEFIKIKKGSFLMGDLKI